MHGYCTAQRVNEYTNLFRLSFLYFTYDLSSFRLQYPQYLGEDTLRVTFVSDVSAPAEVFFPRGRAVQPGNAGLQRYVMHTSSGTAKTTAHTGDAHPMGALARVKVAAVYHGIIARHCTNL